LAPPTATEVPVLRHRLAYIKASLMGAGYVPWSEFGLCALLVGDKILSKVIRFGWKFTKRLPK